MLVRSQKSESEVRSHSQKSEPESDPAIRLSARSDVDGANFSVFKAAYPKRGGTQLWARAVKAAKARVKEGATV